jgi:hypothetical protein
METSVTLGMLWLPMLVAAAVVFVVASLVWMVLPHHKKDYARIPGEDEVTAVLKKHGVGAGQYSFPYAADMAAMKDPAFVKKLEEGPSGFLIIRPAGSVGMGASMVLYFVYCLVVSLFVAYITSRTLGAGSPYLQVFRVAGTVAILAYVGALAPASIWMGKRWSITLKEMLDGVIYGLLTAGVFGWLWPR